MAGRTFLDTGVLRAAFEGEEPASSRALEIIADATRQFIVSDILRLELLPMPIFNERPEEREFFEHYFSIAAQDVAVTPERTAGALEVAARYGMNACDALHIEVARVAGAEEFITTEKPTKPFFRVTEGALIIVPLVPPPAAAAAPPAD